MTDTGIAFKLGNFPVYWYGVLISIAFGIGIVLAYRLAQKRGFDADEVFNLAFLILPAAIIGARAYYVVMKWPYYSANPGSILKVWEGGLAFHGGLILALIAAYLYMRHKKLPFLAWADIFIPFVALGQAIGRWGNYFNQEAYGYETDLPWGMLIDGVTRHPTFLYESLWNFGIFIYLMRTINRPSKIRPYKEGLALAWYFILYSFGRFFIEALRTDSLMLGPFRVAQIVSVLGFALGIWLLFRLRHAPPAVAPGKAGVKAKKALPKEGGKPAAPERPYAGKKSKKKKR